MKSIDLDIRKNEKGDGFAIHFERLFFSDIHWGTKHCRAKQLLILMALLECRIFSLGGDIIDLEKMERKQKWNYPDAHLLGMAHCLWRASKGTQVRFKPGNHDHHIRKTALMGQELFGVVFEDHEVFKGPDGRVILNIHGDQFDGEIAKDNRSFLYRFFDGFYSAIQEIDWHASEMGLQIRIASFLKRNFKKTINWGMDYYKRLDTMAKKLGASVVVHGHSHNMSFENTPGDILKIDDGCATDHVQACGLMADGTFVSIELRGQELRFEDEKGHKRIIHLDELEKQLGCEGFLQTLPEAIPEEFIEKARNSLRVLYRMAPPKDHSDAVKNIRATRQRIIDTFNAIAPDIGLHLAKLDQGRTIAVHNILDAVRTLTPAQEAQVLKKGLQEIYHLAAMLEATEPALRVMPEQLWKRTRFQRPKEPSPDSAPS